MKLLLCTLTLFIATSIAVYGQYSDSQLDKIIAESSNRKLLLESSQMLQNGYFIAAERLVDKLLQTDSENCNYNYRKGFILAVAKSDYPGAIPYLEKAVKKIDKHYDMFSGHEKSAGDEALFYLGRCYHRIGNFYKARKNYDDFIDRTTRKTDLTRAAQLGLYQLEVAQKLMEHPKDNVTVTNLGSVINSSFPEYAPVISFDGSSLYFTSRRGWEQGQTADFMDPQYGLYPEDIYVSYRDFSGTWSQPQRLEFCKSDQNEASLSVSPDESRIYVYQDVVGNGDVFYSDFSANRFRDIQPFDNKKVNTKFWDTHCIVSPDGSNVYFASERPGGFGGRDIYRIVKLPDGEWGKPFNLGPKINSEFDEDAPFVASDNKTLYYASNGPASMGGFDIMLVVMSDDNNWSDPINLGYPINSPQDDIFYTETIDGRRGYITSTRSDSKGEKDIYEVQTDYMNIHRGVILKGKITVVNTLSTPEDLTVTVACTDCDGRPDRTVYPRTRDGAFMMTLEPCHTYDLIFRRHDGQQECHRERFETDCQKEKEEIYREVVLDADFIAIAPLKDTTMETTTVIPSDTAASVISSQYEQLAYRHTFGYNKNELLAADQQLKTFLKQVDEQIRSGRESLTIEIYTSASTVPTVGFKNNQELSELRATNLKKMLEEHFTTAGYGKKVQITIVSAVVSGPEYENDSENIEKYMPFQFVELKTK